MSYAIGIDPPAGLAIWDRSKQRFLSIETTDFWGIIDRLDSLIGSGTKIKVFIEAPQENKPVWMKGGVNNLAIFSKVCQNVGENKGSAKLIIEWCKRRGVDHVALRPTKRSATKLSVDRFQQITGWKKRTSEHGRDAAMKVYSL